MHIRHLSQLKRTVGVRLSKFRAYLDGGSELNDHTIRSLVQRVVPRGWGVFPSDDESNFTQRQHGDGAWVIGLDPKEKDLLYAAYTGFHEAGHAHYIEHGKGGPYVDRVRRIWEQMPQAKQIQFSRQIVKTPVYEVLPPPFQELLHSIYQEEKVCWRYAQKVAHQYGFKSTPALEKRIAYSLHSYEPKDSVCIIVKQISQILEEDQGFHNTVGL
jgi:hypothetical protein